MAETYGLNLNEERLLKQILLINNKIFLPNKKLNCHLQCIRIIEDNPELFKNYQTQKMDEDSDENNEEDPDSDNKEDDDNNNDDKKEEKDKENMDEDDNNDKTPPITYSGTPRWGGICVDANNRDWFCNEINYLDDMMI